MKKTRVLVVGTGGTASMADVGADGKPRYAMRYSAEDLVGMVRKIYTLRRFEIDCLELTKYKKDSVDYLPSEARDISRAIYEALDGHDTAIAIRGSDNFPYLCADSAFRAPAGTPAINTMAQIPANSKRVPSDVIDNIAHCFYFAEQQFLLDVAVLRDKIFLATRLEKRASGRKQPYEEGNGSVIGCFGNEIRDNNKIMRNMCREKPTEAILGRESCDSLAKIKLHEISMGSEPWEVESYMGKCDGLILSGYANWNVPHTKGNDFVPAIEKAVKNGLVVMLRDKSYIDSTGSMPYVGANAAQQAGAILLPPMVPDAAKAKASIMLALTHDLGEIEKGMRHDWAGEVLG